MIITVASYKGGVAKTTTAIHLAAYLQTLAPTLLLDADDTRNAINYGKRGPGFPFRAASYNQAAVLVKGYEHVVIDTGQRPTQDDLEAVAQSGPDELLVIPAPATAMEKDSNAQTLVALQALKATRYRVLLTRVAPYSAKAAAELRADLAEEGMPVFQAEIPRLAVFEKAADSGQIVRDVHDRYAARAWEAYVAAGKEIV